MTTATEYGAQITELIDAEYHGFAYPDDFESEVQAHFLRRTPVREAATAIVSAVITASPVFRKMLKGE